MLKVIFFCLSLLWGCSHYSSERNISNFESWKYIPIDNDWIKESLFEDFKNVTTNIQAIQLLDEIEKEIDSDVEKGDITKRNSFIYYAKYFYLKSFKADHIGHKKNKLPELSFLAYFGKDNIQFDLKVLHLIKKFSWDEDKYKHEFYMALRLFFLKRVLKNEFKFQYDSEIANHNKDSYVSSYIFRHMRYFIANNNYLQNPQELIKDYEQEKLLEMLEKIQEEFITSVTNNFISTNYKFHPNPHVNKEDVFNLLNLQLFENKKWTIMITNSLWHASRHLNPGPQSLSEFFKYFSSAKLQTLGKMIEKNYKDYGRKILDALFLHSHSVCTSKEKNVYPYFLDKMKKIFPQISWNSNNDLYRYILQRFQLCMFHKNALNGLLSDPIYKDFPRSLTTWNQYLQTVFLKILEKRKLEYTFNKNLADFQKLFQKIINDDNSFFNLKEKNEYYLFPELREQIKFYSLIKIQAILKNYESSLTSNQKKLLQKIFSTIIDHITKSPPRYTLWQTEFLTYFITRFPLDEEKVGKKHIQKTLELTEAIVKNITSLPHYEPLVNKLTNPINKNHKIWGMPFMHRLEKYLIFWKQIENLKFHQEFLFGLYEKVIYGIMKSSFELKINNKSKLNFIAHEDKGFKSTIPIDENYARAYTIFSYYKMLQNKIDYFNKAALFQKEGDKWSKFVTALVSKIVLVPDKKKSTTLFTVMAVMFPNVIEEVIDHPKFDFDHININFNLANFLLRVKFDYLAKNEGFILNKNNIQKEVNKFSNYILGVYFNNIENNNNDPQILRHYRGLSQFLKISAGINTSKQEVRD